MRPTLRSALRILSASALLLVLLFSLAAWAITQPTFEGLASQADGPRAVPRRLRNHVQALTAFSPRDSDHPENLDRAACYIRRHLSRTRARVEDQVFEARGKVYRNVLATFGPEAGPLLVIGAHYDTFGDFGPNPGADDNASGVAGLLELARLLDGRDLSHRVQLVAYANEEPPYFASPWMGSAVHARSLRGQDVQGMDYRRMAGVVEGVARVAY